MRTRALIPVVFLTLIAAACGGSDDAGIDGPTETAPPTTAAADDPTTTDDDAADDDTTTEDDTTDNDAADDDSADDPADDEQADDEPADDDEEATPPLLESAPIPVISVADIPGLVVEWGTGTGDPLDIARRLIGFPLEIAVPDGASPYSVRVELDGRDTTADWRWDWRYGSTTTASAVGEVDAELPEGGPGTIEGRLHFDPLFAGYGWSNVAQVISDPSSGGGGPQSVNWAYQKDDPLFRLGEINGEAIGARAWVDEDIDFRDGDDVPGYQVDISVAAQPNFIPVPLLEALFREVPVAPGARLIELDFVSYDRPADSFAAEEGTRYLELTYVCELLPNSEMAAREVYSAGLAGTAYQMGEESFFDEGFIEVVEATVDANGVWRQPVIVMDRYPGAISVWVDDDGTVMSRVDVTLEPNREVLELLPE